MCNIAGYVGHKQAAPILIEMLKKQEAYDAGIFTGIATIHEGRLYYRKVYGTAATLEQETDALSLPGTIGIIHGRPGGTPDTFSYSHPFVPDAENRAFVLNGTCPDSHLSKQRNDGAQNAADAGYHFLSARYAEKDSYPQLQNGQYVAIGEVIMHLTDYYRKQGYCQQEAFALAASDEYTDLVALMLDLETPDTISALRISRPMYLLTGEGESFLATCPFAFPLKMQDQCISLPLMHVCEITKDACTITGIKVPGEAVCSITPYAYAEAYRRVVDLLTGHKDHPLVYDDVEIAILNMTDLWPEQHTCSPYAQLAYEVLLQLQREGRLRQEIRNQPYAAGNTTRPRAMLWLE